MTEFCCQWQVGRTNHDAAYTTEAEAETAAASLVRRGVERVVVFERPVGA